MTRCLIALGSNLGDRVWNLNQAVEQLARQPGVRLVARSGWIETHPVGGPADQAGYLNGAILVECELEPAVMLRVLMDIEAGLGRQRQTRWGPRTLDLDLLLFGSQVVDTEALRIPHPRMAFRRFVLEPAAQVAGEMVHPTTGWTLARLLAHLDSAADYVAIAGPIGVGKSWLAEQLAGVLPARWVAEWFDPSGLARFYADPSRTAWEMELEFLQDRTRRLAADRPEWRRPARGAISDFWFDQSAAFGRVWLMPQQREAFRQQWEQSRRLVVQPKLVVLLDAPTDLLLERIRRRGRPGEGRLTGAVLDRIREEIRAETRQADRGPVLEVSNAGADALAEVHAAIQAMK